MTRAWWPGRSRPRRWRFEPAGVGYFIVWLHPEQRPKPHPPVKANRRRTHRRRT